MITKEQLVAAINESKERGKNRTDRKSRSSGDKALYPFWDAPLNETVSLRFLPDGDPENLTSFWAAREVIKLPFAGIVGGDYPTSKPVEVTVPCMNMFKKRCAISDYCRPWWDDNATSAQKALARKYWKKKTFVYQGFVVRSSIVEEEVPENPIRKFTIGPKLHKLIEASLIDPEMAELPIHYTAGRDFSVKKTKLGDYNNYDTSSWSMNGARALTETERDAIDTFGLFNLSLSKGEEPNAEKLAIIEAMFHSSLNGDPFDVASFGDYYRAYANNRDAEAADNAAVAETSRPTVIPVKVPEIPVEKVVETVAQAPVDEAPRKQTPHELLASIRARLPQN